MSWGTELWDKYDELCRHTSGGMDFVESSVAFFIRERGKIEGEYAAKLRKLVGRCMPPDNAYSDGEFTHIRAYKQMLNELGFQAGQHEVLADNFSKEKYKNILDVLKQMKEKRKRHMKEADKIAQDLKRAFKVMDAHKDKFRKAYADQQKAESSYKRAENDGNVARNEIEKLRQQMITQTQACESMNGKYASQLIKTNDYQRDYYSKLLPSVLDELQNFEKDRIRLVRDTLKACVLKEKEVNPIINQCQDAVVNAMDDINLQEDTEIIIEKYKSGDIPPGDFKFNDMSSPLEMLNKDVVDRPTNFNLYPLKKRLEKEIDFKEKELRKCQKELQSLQTMVTTYEKNPKFGDSRKFHSEITTSQQKIREMEDSLLQLNNEHADVEDRLEALKGRSPMAGSPLLLQRDQTPRSSHSSGSLKSSSLSIGSTQASSIAINNCPDYAVPEPGGSIYDIQPNYHEEEWSDRYEYSPELSRCKALYPYDGDSDPQSNTIPMAEGEIFHILEPDYNGWTLVRRMDSYNADRFEGFVPSSFVERL